MSMPEMEHNIGALDAPDVHQGAACRSMSAGRKSESGTLTGTDTARTGPSGDGGRIPEERLDGSTDAGLMGGHWRFWMESGSGEKE
ncbi:Hypothetical predicted protein [Pelobates cultripes]|uniref:Uncharacterized protein n=1 Tax=Pelobates cultripes TaxID=61616 RepID=A0AAD1R1E8_PELCU|nr:Hypothetical predicted protein [Pelobates cultripes]